MSRITHFYRTRIFALTFLTAFIFFSPADAATLTARRGQFMSAQNSPGASTNSVQAGRGEYLALWISCDNTGTVNWQVENDIGEGFVTVRWSGATNDDLAFLDTSGSVLIPAPVGIYRINTTVCTGCTHSCSYWLAAPE